jgi:hypothetical protein
MFPSNHLHPSFDLYRKFDFLTCYIINDTGVYMIGFVLVIDMSNIN